MKWVIKQIKTLPYNKVMDFLKHSLERDTLEEALESREIMIKEYKYTETIHEEDQNPNYEIISRLLSLELPKPDIHLLIKNY
jgi:translation initiation factor IF-3